MHDNDGIELPQLPFLTREMLKFGDRSKFELVVRSNQTTERTIEVRGFTRSGRINIKHVGTSITTLSETIHQIPDIPIMIAVAPTALANTHGDLYVSVSLRIDGDISIPLVSGYVTQAKGLSWPHTNLTDLISGRGEMDSIQVTQPAAGANWTHTVPDNRVWHIQSITFHFVTDANVGVRASKIKITHLGTSTMFFFANDTLNNNSIRDVTYSAAPLATEIDFSSTFAGAIPPNLWVVGGDTIETLTSNIQVGDQYSIIAINVEAFFEGA